MDLAADKLAYTVNEAVKATGIGRTTLFNLMRDGELARVKFGAATVIRRADLQQLLDTRTTAS